MADIKQQLRVLGVDMGAIAYIYPGSSSGDNGADWNANTQEAYLGLSYGPVTFKTSYVLSKSYFASTGNSGGDASGTMYYDLTLSQEVAPKLIASIHAGYTDYNGKANTYADDVKVFICRL
jgi:uncharacterized protein (TIGR02001 family)